MPQLSNISAEFTDRAMDVVEQTLLAADWACERSEEGMIHCASMTKWGEFGGMFAWRDEPASLNFSLTLDLRAPNAKQSAISELLRTIDGVGLMVAVTILAEVPQISAFERARDVAAFAGLTPSLSQSGTSVKRRGAMTKEGSALLRKMLYMAALQAVKRTNNAFHSCYNAFVERGKSKMCALGAIMHKIIRVAFGVLKHDTPFVKNFAKLEA